MSAFTTEEITREQALEYIMKIQFKESYLHPLEKQYVETVINAYADSEKHRDILPILTNFKVI